ncbi:hypothetical protein ABPG72_000391 [Tetrahymena utriculariae]
MISQEQGVMNRFNLESDQIDENDLSLLEPVVKRTLLLLRLSSDFNYSINIKSENKINSLSFQKLSEDLAKCLQLKAIDLDISQNYIQNDQYCSKALEIIFTIVHNLKLFSLNLNQNQLGINYKAANLFACMHRSSSLEYLCLNLDQTQIADEEVQQIGFSIKELKILKDILLSIQQNNFKLFKTQSISVSICRGNEFSKFGLSQVVEGFNSCKNLNRLG